MGRRRLLIVDDEVAVLTALQLAFEGVDWHIDVVTSGAMAVERHRGARYDLIIVDKNLPDLDGVRVIRELRRDDPVVRFVLITGFASKESAVETANLGIEAYLEKPFADIFEVRRVVETCLSRPPKPKLVDRMRQAVATFGRPLTHPPASSPPPAASKSLPPLPGQPPSRVTLTPARPTRAAAGPAILVSCAEERLRQLLAAELESLGVKTLLAATADETIESIARDRPAATIVGGGVEVSDVVTSVSAAEPAAVLLVASERLDVTSLKWLVMMGVTTVLDQPPDSAGFKTRLGQLVDEIKRHA